MAKSSTNVVEIVTPGDKLLGFVVAADVVQASSASGVPSVVVHYRSDPGTRVLIGVGHLDNVEPFLAKLMDAVKNS